jgi:hypothetical protein
MQELLRYESIDSGTLEPGEQLLWEGGARHRGRPRYRITNRRAFCIDGKENSAKHFGTVRWPFHQVVVINVRSNRRATIHLGTGLWILEVNDWTTAVQQICFVNRGRTVRPRRISAKTKMEKVMDRSAGIVTDATGIDYSSIATDLGLLEGEQVLWTGRPIVNQPIVWPVIRRKLLVILAMFFPTVMMLKALNDKPTEPSDVMLGLFAAIWFIIAISSLTLWPIIRRWRLGRTQYVVSSRRAFIIEPSNGGRRIRFVFIDALPAHFDRVMQLDGSGDINVAQGFVFKQIPQVSAVHQQLMESVLAARRDLPDLGWQDLSSRAPGI